MAAEENKPSQRIRVHDTALYTQLMNAADWSHIIESEGREQRNSLAKREAEIALLRQQEREKANEVKHRLELLMLTRSRRKREEKQERKHVKEFRERMRTLRQHHNELASKCAAVCRSDVVRAQRALQRLGWQREELVLRPIQEAINEAISDDASSRFRAALRLKMIESYVEECNRANVSASRGVFRDVFDPVLYNPFLQREMCTIRYPRPPQPRTVVDIHRSEAEEIEKKYEQLALDYRKLQAESLTGALSKPSLAAGPLHTLTQRATPSDEVVDFPVGQLSYFPRRRATSSSNPPELRSLKDPRGSTESGDTEMEPNRMRILPPLTRGPERSAAGACAVLGSEPSGGEVMPFLGARETENDRLVQWMRQRRRSVQTRFGDLPVTAWEHFPQTSLGWNTAPDGSTKAFSKRRVDFANYRQYSQVELAYYSGPGPCPAASCEGCCADN
ncbi:unnamed protein product [Trypanosoma congolense IL3000]|uniref:WGS project CAEQ00000000 data, annotated contig 257 n=1 Tax=Trypanosoma congolense (strain IL3000) TaxID=1068625 RepID=F9WEE9_TRYCI|nr:unnamed protein product [Trypanosoma congolense IL3000]